MIVGNGELTMGKETEPKHDVLKNAHEIVCQVHWPVAPGSNVVLMDLILIETKGAKCQVNVEKDMEKARARIREINPGKTFIDNECGLACASTEPLASRELAVCVLSQANFMDVARGIKTGVGMHT